jgi:uncharacterized protein (AIM24 family)
MLSYTDISPGQSMTAASTFLGWILTLNMSEGSYIGQKSVFLCAQPEVRLSVAIPKGVKGGLFGGGGFILQKVRGLGWAFWN